MTLIEAIRLIFAAVAEWLRRQTAHDNQELGRLKEREANAEADKVVRDAIDRADPGRVSDDVFGVGGFDHNLQSLTQRRTDPVPDRE